MQGDDSEQPFHKRARLCVRQPFVLRGRTRVCVDVEMSEQASTCLQASRTSVAQSKDGKRNNNDT